MLEIIFTIKQQNKNVLIAIGEGALEGEQISAGRRRTRIGRQDQSKYKEERTGNLILKILRPWEKRNNFMNYTPQED